MLRIERVEIFGGHIISAIARDAPGGGSWEVDVAAVALGNETVAPLVRFSPTVQIVEDPSAAIEVALQKARRELVVKSRREG